MLTVAFDESTINRKQVQLWYNRFKESREDVNDDAHPGHPSMSITNDNIKAVKKMILLMMFAYVRLKANSFYVRFRYETCGFKDCSNL